LKKKVVYYVNFGRNFLKARKRRGLEQKDAAAALEVSPAFLSKVENDKSRPSIDLILKAAEFYGVEPGFFFKDQIEVDLETFTTEKNKRFINDLNDLTDKELAERYKIQLDGKELTSIELKGILAYVRSLRSMEE
jgi:transcriptional regulator with XRE-family HTH domain